jgi:hypothetical protein
MAEKAKARQCFKRCGCNRVQSTRFENNQSIGNPAIQKKFIINAIIVPIVIANFFI